jgi:hypothetical protein
MLVNSVFSNQNFVRIMNLVSHDDYYYSMDFESTGRSGAATSLDSARLMFNTKLLLCIM